jgi:hypothetical protein
MAQKLYNTKFVVVNMTKRVTNNNWLHVGCMPVANDKISNSRGGLRLEI